MGRSSVGPFRKAWLNGKIVELKDITMSPFSYCAQYGVMPFEGIRFYLAGRRRAIFRLEAHVKRLFNSMETVRMALPYSRFDVENGIKELVGVSNLEEGYIRPTVFLREPGVGLRLVRNELPSVAVSLWPLESCFRDAGIRMATSSFIRLHPRSIIPGAKISGYYINSVFALEEAVENGVDEALFLDSDGGVAEGSSENIFMVKRGILYTPDSESILPGITRATIVEIAGWIGLKVEICKIKPKNLYCADEVFLVGTAAEVVPVVEIDRKKIGKGRVGSITSMIRDAYFRVVRAEWGELPVPGHWLSFVDRKTL